jgi:aldehyde:ferredoxin oxidoreductase
MEHSKLYGYFGRLLKVDLGKKEIESVSIDADTLRNYVGGAALGIRYIYDNVPPETAWSDPENLLFLGSGPLGGTRIGGSGAIAVVTKGALTNGMASSQANGFFGAYLRFSGYDGLVITGIADDWSYLHIHDDMVEIKDATHLRGKPTLETENILKKELGKKKREASVLTIGPAGENLVKFSVICGDGGHIAAHNGVGAVMGSKKLKALFIERAKKGNIPLKDRTEVTRMAGVILDHIMAGKGSKMAYEEGTVGGVIFGTQMGNIPVKNYTTCVNPMSPEVLDTYTTQNIREKFKAKPSPCWACGAKHSNDMEIPEGKYAGRAIEEPEYESMGAFSTLVGIEDVTTTVLLASEVDRLGIDVNETGWIMGWLMECREKQILTKEDMDGIDMSWGNGEAIMAMMNKICYRDGFGDILAEGIMRAAMKIGGKATDMAIYTMKGNTPRGHDHRAVWLEMFDTCVSNLGTLEAHPMAPFRLLGLDEIFDTFDWKTISTVAAKIRGAMIFEDSMITCRFNTATALDLLCKAVNAAAGWNMNVEDAMNVGRRAVNLARIFNLRNGIGADLDRPSFRYGSTPEDGVAAGRSIMAHWDEMLHNYYNLMGWNEDTGIPLPETLKKLELDSVVSQLDQIR